MEPKLQRRVQRYGWDRAAEHYGRYWDEQLRPAHDELIRVADIQPDEQVLDVACGSGQVTLQAAERTGSAGRVTGLDISAKMVSEAEAIASSQGVTNATFQRADAENLGVDESAFDVALCSLGLMYVPEPTGAVVQMHDALRVGGRVVVSVWGERRNCGWAEIFPIVDQRVESDVCPMFFSLGAPGAIEATLYNAGFVDIEVQRLRVDLAYANDAEALGAAFLGGPVALPYGRFDDTTKGEVEREYLGTLAQFGMGDRYLVPGEFVVASATRP
jgi:ubiquinone/menaquinone biosynthesis C-methylase UbiE